ncbi:hypothetical protein AWI74_14425 [Listeria monocytogenes]|nr:hypothetical protein AWI74_14425 [Listeria monocytogenes]
MWGITSSRDEEKTDAAIRKKREFFESPGAVTRFSDSGLGEEVVDLLVDQLDRHGLTNISERGDQTLEVSRQIYTNAL